MYMYNFEKCSNLLSLSSIWLKILISTVTAKFRRLQRNVFGTPPLETMQIIVVLLYYLI